MNQQPATLTANLDHPQRPLTEEEWNVGRGCSEHRARRSGSCHDCAMLEPPEPEELAHAW